MPRLCVFCGSSSGIRPIYADTAQRLGTLLATRGIGLVYGGSRLGLMGMITNACLEAGGEVTGIIPKFMVDREVAHHGVTHLRIVDSMHERKAMMAELADAFVALPGGFGTWDEFCEIVTWAQIKLHSKPFAMLNIDGYYDHFLAQADHAVAEGFVRATHRELVQSAVTPEELLGLLF